VLALYRLEDVSPYVRKTAVMAVVKIFNVDPKMAKPMVASLEKMLRDRDPQVAANCIVALQEIRAKDGGLTLDKSIVFHLLNRIKEFSEWSQCIVLELVAHYSPESEKDVFDIMVCMFGTLHQLSASSVRASPENPNQYHVLTPFCQSLLDERLSSANAGVVLATAKVFLNFTVNMPKIHKQAYQRIKDPLLTLMTGGGPEMAFTVLSHIKCLADRCAQVFEGESGIFDKEYKKFFCRYNDPLYVKIIKLDILRLIATDESVKSIVEELREYVTDVNIEVARQAIRTIGNIAWRLPLSAQRVIGELLGLLEMDIDYVSAETVIAMKDLLRKYPERINDVVHIISQCLATLEEADARVAVLWMLGEYGHVLEEGPYVLEPLIDSWDEETSATVHLELLTASLKLFFKRPGEMQKMLGRLFVAATTDTNNNDVHDRALFYYRLLEHDVQEAQDIICGHKDRITTFVEETETEIKDRIFEEFNTLSVVYDQPSEKFIRQTLVNAAGALVASKDKEQDDDEEDEEEEEEQFTLQQSLTPGRGSPQVFEKKWGTCHSSKTMTLMLRGAASEAKLDSVMKSVNMHNVAKGKQNGVIKAYYIGERSDAKVFMAEIIINTQVHNLEGTLKSDEPKSLLVFEQCLTSALSQL